MTGFEPVPQGLEGPWATVTPHSLWFGLRVSNPSLRAGNAGCSLHTQAERGTGVVHRPIDIRQLSKTPLMRAGGRQGIRIQTLPLVPPMPMSLHVSNRLKTSTRLDADFLRASGQNKKGPLGDLPQKACFSMSAEPLGRLASVGAIEHGTGVAHGPRFGHESRHTGGAPQRASQTKWPRWRCALRFEELNRHFEPQHGIATGTSPDIVYADVRPAWATCSGAVSAVRSAGRRKEAMRKLKLQMQVTVDACLR